MQMTTAILLEGMEFYAHHGCFAEEQSVGTRFVVDVGMEADLEVAAETDSIGQTIDYSAVYQRVKEEMAKPSHLIENVALRIAKTIIEHHEKAQNVTVKVAKLNPAVGGMVQKSSVTITLHR
jgi:dihydroneopterin aldolase